MPGRPIFSIVIGAIRSLRLTVSVYKRLL